MVILTSAGLDITQLIGTLGFPIVMCGILCWYIYNKQSESDAKIDKMTEALNNNTAVISKLIDRLDANNGD